MTVASRLRDHGPMTTRPDIPSLSIACPPPDEGVVEVRPIVNGREPWRMPAGARRSRAPELVRAGPSS